MSILHIAKLALHNGRARDELDNFFAGEVVPRLCQLNLLGRVPDLSGDPIWLKVEHEWQSASETSQSFCDVEKVKQLMTQAVDAYERRIRSQPGLFEDF